MSSAARLSPFGGLKAISASLEGADAWLDVVKTSRAHAAQELQQGTCAPWRWQHGPRAPVLVSPSAVRCAPSPTSSLSLVRRRADATVLRQPVSAMKHRPSPWPDQGKHPVRAGPRRSAPRQAPVSTASSARPPEEILQSLQDFFGYLGHAYRSPFRILSRAMRNPSMSPSTEADAADDAFDTNTNADDHVGNASRGTLQSPRAT